MDSDAKLKYDNYEWDRPFDPDEYKNAMAIRLLYENGIRAAAERDRAALEVQRLKDNVAALDKKDALAEKELAALRKRKWLPFSLQVVAIVTSGLGVNLITSRPDEPWGWLFLIISLLLEILAYITVRTDA